MKKNFLSFMMIVILALPACAPQTNTGVPIPSPAPTISHVPTAAMPMLTMVEYGFRFRYPPEYQAGIHRNQICLTLEQGYGPPGLCHVQNFSLEISDVPDRPLIEIAGEAAPESIRRESLTVGGEQAILLDHIPAQDWIRMVVIVHDDRLYKLTFVGWPLDQPENSQQGVLYNTIIDSFEFLPQPVIQNYEQIEFGISAVVPVTIYSFPSQSSDPAAVLEAGTPAQVIGRVEGIWLEIDCPAGIPRRCWVRWDPNALYSYEGPLVALEIPDPASLKIETASETTSPEGRWQALSIRSETVTLGVEGAIYFHVELIVTSLEDGTKWVPVSEWHAAGLGEEQPPQPFYWSKDGHFLYYTSISYPDGACAFYDNIGESLDRLDLIDGSVAEVRGYPALGMAAISPDESMIAHITAQPFIGGPRYHLLVQDLQTAYTKGGDMRGSIKSMIWLDKFPQENISRIAWSPDNRKVLVTVTEVADNCHPSTVAEWELEVQTGEFIQVSNTVLPTATP
jgi:hypothetical protein